jgi:1,4-alpha-glucan branching enzyme
MALPQDHIDSSTPMGANLTNGGATFRVWAPGALHVYLALNGAVGQPSPSMELVKNPLSGHWTGYAKGVQDGTKYRYFVVGPGGQGLKRDPWARELDQQGLPDCDCIVRSSASYPWHDGGFVPPAFSDLVVYQFHVGRFYARDPQGNDNRLNRVAKLLDAIDRVPYWVDLGVNAVQPLPLVEFPGEWSLGYNGTDLFSPDQDYCLAPADLPAYLGKVNALLAQRGQGGLTLGQLSGHVNQVKAFVDVCHCYGIAVIPDVVYNHCGGTLDPQSLDYFDFPTNRSAENSIYFSANGWAGGKVFAFTKPEVESYLIANAAMFLQEYHADGLRFDEVTVIDRMGGWFFAQHMTDTLRFTKPAAALIAEYWGQDRWLGTWPTPAGMGFDIGYSDGIRDAVRTVLAQAAGGANASVDLNLLVPGLERPWNVSYAWQSYNCLENQDLVLDSDGDHRKPRIARLADATNARSWYARSRSRVATGILLTSPGVPMLFMGEEFLEDKLWSDDPHRNDLLIWWDGLDRLDPVMSDFHRCTRDLLRVRHRQPALRADPVNVFHIDTTNRVLAFHRWVPGIGQDVVVVASLNESAFSWGSYQLGLPLAGEWQEAFNSDLYDGFPNPGVQGNGGRVFAGGPPRDGLPASAGLTIPANGLLVLSRESGG